MVNAPVDLVEAPIGVLSIEPPVIVAPWIVLLVNVSLPANVAKVPVVGSVTLVLPVVVKPRVCAPEWVKLPPRVIVLDPLFTPVPPYVGPIIVPCQVPVPIVPRVVIEV